MHINGSHVVLVEGLMAIDDVDGCLFDRAAIRMSAVATRHFAVAFVDAVPNDVETPECRQGKKITRH